MLLLLLLLSMDSPPACAPSARYRLLQRVLELHQEHGAHYHAPGFHSGYNELILNSRAHNERLPHSVEAFFVPQGHSAVTADLGYGIRIDVVVAHRAFLRVYGLTAEQVPLLRLDPANWEEPFREYDPDE